MTLTRAPCPFPRAEGAPSPTQEPRPWFTTPEGASEVQKSHPGCRAAVAVEASWMMATVPVGCGLAIDAGTDGCRFLEPDSVGWLREEMRRAA